MDYRNNFGANPFLTFIFSLIPGAAHMYLGLMIRGSQLLLAFLVSLFLAISAGIEALFIPLCVLVYIFNLYDSYHCRKLISLGVGVEDEPILKSIKLNAYTLGIGLVSVGGLYLLGQLKNLNGMSAAYYDIVWNVGSLLPAVLIGAVGLYFLVKGINSDDKPQFKVKLNDLKPKQVVDEDETEE